MSDMDTRDITMMRDIYGIGERGERLGGNDYPVDGPTTMCPACSEELPEPDGECSDPECAEWLR